MRRRATSLRDPRYCHIILDANALDRVDSYRSAEVDEFQRLSRELTVIKPHGVEAELSHPRTPTRSRQDMDEIFTIPTNLTHDETLQRERLRSWLSGNSNSNKHVADADHLFEATKYGGGYFVTHDQRILRRKSDLQNFAPGLKAVTLTEMVEILRIYIST